MKVLHVTPSFYPAVRYGGTTYTTYGLCNALAATAGIDLNVLTTDADGPRIFDRVNPGDCPEYASGAYPIYYCRRWLAHSVSPSLLLRLIPMIKHADVVHVTAVYSAPVIPALLVSKMLQKPVVWSTRGALQRWQLSSRLQSKKLWEFACNMLCDPQRVVLHVTSQQEALESKARIPRAGISVIPNGIDVFGEDQERMWKPNGTLRLLYLGRLHPIKGLENLLRALKHVNEKVRLTVCGEGELSYKLTLERLVNDLSLDEQVEFAGEVSPEEKSRRFREADVCVAPSFKENFCVAVAEALAHGVPVIASKGTPWDQLEQVGCGFWVENDPEALARTIARISGSNLREMGEKGRRWMQQEFTWKKVAGSMAELYKELVSGPQMRTITAMTELSVMR